MFDAEGHDAYYDMFSLWRKWEGAMDQRWLVGCPF